MAETFSFNGGVLLAGLALFQVIGALRPVKTISYLDHLVGMAVGFVAARWWQSNNRKGGQVQRKATKWWETLPGRKS